MIQKPLLVVVFGAVVGLSVVRVFFTPQYLSVVILTAAAGSLVAILVASDRSILNPVSLFLFGFAGFVLYGGILSYQQRTRRTWLQNRRLNIEGIWRPPDTLIVHRINGLESGARLYLDPEQSRRELKQYKADGTVRLNATGVVRWHSLGESFRSFLHFEDYQGYLDVNRVHSVEILSRATGNVVVSLRRMTDRFLDSIRPRAPTSVALIRSLLVGEKNFSNKLSQLLRRFGVYHLFVISGLHVGALFYGLRWVLGGIPERVRSLLVGAVLLAYVTFLGWPIPASRALVMLGIGGLTVWLNRRSTLADITVATVWLFLLVDPFVVFQAGFQLSVGAVIGIVLVRPYLERLPRGWGVRLLVVTTGAFFGVLPVILFHFGYVSPVALLGGYAGTAGFPVLVALLLAQLVLLSLGWSALYRPIDVLLESGVWGLTGLFQDWSLLIDVPGVTVTGVLVVAILLVVCLDRGTPRSLRLAGLAMLAGALYLGQAGGRDPFVTVSVLREHPYVVFYSEENRTGLYVPPGARLETYAFRTFERHLQSLGIHHLDVFVSDYSRGMIRGVDPAFTIGTVVVHWSDRLTDEGAEMALQSDSGHLTTGSLSLEFNGKHGDGFPVRPNGIAVVSSTNVCLVNDPAVLSSGIFEQLRRSGCEVYFLREAPVRFNLVGEVIGRGSVTPRSFSDRILDRLTKYF